MTTDERFTKLLSNLTLTDAQKADGETKHRGVRRCLNSHYYNSNSDTANSLLVGSWGKGTRIRPPRDIDVLFTLPYAVYQRFEQRPGNRQSQLLQEVKGVLERTYSTTTMRGDGQVVMIRFGTYAVEVVPAFALDGGGYWICDTNGGGTYKKTDPKAEIAEIDISNKATNNNTRDLIRMMKCWQAYCSVPLKSFQIELLAVDFLKTWQWRGNSKTYYDWMTRDFFRYILTRVNSYVFVPGTFELVWLGEGWKSRAESALGRADKACVDESKYPCLAGDEWQKIFGSDIPMR